MWHAIRALCLAGLVVLPFACGVQRGAGQPLGAGSRSYASLTRAMYGVR